jgi:hypothetical protein
VLLDLDGCAGDDRCHPCALGIVEVRRARGEDGLDDFAVRADAAFGAQDLEDVVAQGVDRGEQRPALAPGIEDLPDPLTSPSRYGSFLWRCVDSVPRKEHAGYKRVCTLLVGA